MIYSIPSLVEKNITDYLSAEETLSYPVFQSFGTTDFTLPCVLVKSDKFTQLENSGVFEGNLAVSIITQIDDVEDPLAAHDGVASLVYDLMESGNLSTVFNENGNLWFISINSILQDKEDRSLITILEYFVSCQNLTI